MSGGHEDRGAIGAAARARVARALYALAILACVPLAATHLEGLLRALGGAGLAGPLAGLAGALLGVLAADFATGVVHWACDTYGDEDTPWIGEGLIHSFREHHQRPLAMLTHDAIEVNGQPAAAAAVILALLALPAVQAVLRQSPFAYAFLSSLVAVAALGNQLHKWSHTHDPPRLVRELQKRGWILAPRAHARHHRPPHDVAYCIATGWLNGMLDGVGFWRALERGIARLRGNPPRASAPTDAASDSR